MATLLLPCDGSPSALLAVQHAIAEFRQGDAQRIHLLNVQPPFSHYVKRYTAPQLRADFQRERADEELAEARRMLDAAGVPNSAHFQVGDKARCIAEMASQLHCDRVLIGTARKSAFVRAVEHSLTNQLLESCPVPVEVIGGAPARMIERVGIPAGVGAGLALLLASQA
ncbi:universal stress protein (plasmid) [Cupriavidus sp. KK10]|jgi:nucleotide-binding universal stress UspA family protein|uniref:universal stress protein n=1 Tax=Cupriavidus sp. KK10 TaxID=1478019 RepID=UPI001BA98028|nr:universal stress protein [Cupriavidus sp. KK10]QUN32355.1 universal stress protein [Cupriavidus sp. KK10]